LTYQCQQAFEKNADGEAEVDSVDESECPSSECPCSEVSPEKDCSNVRSLSDEAATQRTKKLRRRIETKESAPLTYRTLRDAAHDVKDLVEKLSTGFDTQLARLDERQTRLERIVESLSQKMEDQVAASLRLLADVVRAQLPRADKK
jgi:hypothetical protein